jgi:hypothetical protein
VQPFTSQNEWQLHVENLTALVGHKEFKGAMDQTDADHIPLLIELRDLARGRQNIFDCLAIEVAFPVTFYTYGHIVVTQ